MREYNDISEDWGTLQARLKFLLSDEVNCYETIEFVLLFLHHKNKSDQVSAKSKWIVMTQASSCPSSQDGSRSEQIRQRQLR